MAEPVSSVRGDHAELTSSPRSGRLIKRSSIIVQLCRLINPPAIMLSPSVHPVKPVPVYVSLSRCSSSFLGPTSSPLLFVADPFRAFPPAEGASTGPYPPFHNLWTLTSACCNVGTTSGPVTAGNYTLLGTCGRCEATNTRHPPNFSVCSFFQKPWPSSSLFVCTGKNLDTCALYSDTYSAWCASKKFLGFTGFYTCSFDNGIQRTRW